ncbi:UNVERIFIED_CONTAM: hypothetical protein FKN15_018597 [Acipenser sinensis]
MNLFFVFTLQVQNKLDGCSYAVKRIQVNPASKQFRRIKGEVTLLSRLNHENIVRYYNAWIEKQQMPSSGVLSNESSEQKTSNASPPQDKVNELGLMDNVEDNAPPPALASSVEWSTTVEKSSSAKRGGEDQESSDDEDVFCASFRAYNSDSDSDIIFANGDGSRDGHSQMEYCERSTLRDTIDRGLYQDNSRLWRLFREILDGLAYIHEQAADKCEVEDNVHVIKQDATDNMTGMVGTALYVSPEVEGSTRATYNQKVDLFSLGIIFFEMSYRPMTTASERISVLSQLRLPTIEFPEDFDKTERQRRVITWLLERDPALRPTAAELLKSEHLPPSQMEESELHEVLHHTLANLNGKAYRNMLNLLFSQNISPVMDYTYDIDLCKGSYSSHGAKLQQYVYETVSRVFKTHGTLLYLSGAVKLQTPLFMPKNKKLYEGIEVACFMDHSGMLVMVPYDLRIMFARFVAKNNITNLKRYSIERVFRPRKLDRSHPRELLECAFDIVTSTTNSLLPEAETIYTISEIIYEFPVLQLQTLYKYIDQKGDLPELSPLINTLTKQKTAVAQLAKQGMKDLEEVTGLLKKLGVKLQVVINLGLFYKVQHHSGIIFQFVAFVKRRHRTVPDIVAAGGRYDHLIPQFRGPELSGPIPSAVGASLALEKICAALASMEEPPSISCCDMLVVSVGHVSMDRAIKILQKLWTAGVSADVMYDVSQSQETVQEHCKHVGIACAAFVSEKEGNYIKVKSFEKDRQSEKRILETDLVDHLVQKFRTKFSDDRFTRDVSENGALQNPKASLLLTSGAAKLKTSNLISCTS